MKKWMIKTKRDWGIAAGFLLLLSYLIASRYRQSVNEWLMDFSPEKMSYFNQPENQGVYLVTVLMAALLGSLLWFWQRKMAGKSPVKGLLIILMAAAALLGGVWASYQAECRQIVNTPKLGLKPSVSVSGWTTEFPGKLELTGEEEQKVLELCLNVQALPEEEQELMRERMTETNDISIDIWYPEYKNHSYNLWFFLEGDILCLNRGHSKDEAVFYDGSEIRVLMEEILSARGWENM